MKRSVGWMMGGLVAVLMLSCGRKAAEQSAPAGSVPAALPSGAGSAGAPVESAARSSEGSATAPAGSAEPAVAELDELTSYRAKVKITVQDSNESQVHQMTSETKWVKDPPAKHIISDLAGTGQTMEFIMKGNKTWMKVGGVWMEVSSADETPDMGPDVDEIVPHDLENMTLIGDETVNGVACKHYQVSPQSIRLADPSQGAASTQVEGEVWVAAQRGTPAIRVRERWRAQGSFVPLPGSAKQAQGMVTLIERDILDINQPITIEPPAHTMSIPQMPNLPTPPAGQ